MRVRVRHRRSRWRHSKPLVVRGGLARTFGGLASFLAVLFLCGGIYILEDALANPVAAQPAAVIAGAFSIALATILLFYVLKPSVGMYSPADRRHRRTIASEAPLELPKTSPMAQEGDSRRDLLYQRIYVDHSRIPPRVHI
jgi:hypothetical protein